MFFSTWWVLGLGWPNYIRGMNETERIQDEKSRLALGFLLAAFVFFLTELVFIGRYDHGFVLGLLPAAAIGAAVGCLPTDLYGSESP